MSAQGYARTGQVTCHDTTGREIPCRVSGQDAEFKSGAPWPTPRFEAGRETVLDCLTGLTWTRDANIREFAMTWREALDHAATMNREQVFGFSDWRLPNRREIRSLMSHQTRKPALPEGHPFTNVFSSWYWTSTTAAIHASYAWYVHMEGARMFFGEKEESHLFWPVRGRGGSVLPVTGQSSCHDARGRLVPCAGTGQDGELRTGQPWPAPRFEVLEDAVRDRLTDLQWLRSADLTCAPVTWREALEAVQRVNRAAQAGWRLPNINELESLVDCSMHDPALPAAHPFTDVREDYWSSTTSMFEPDWAWALYLAKGAVGVGQKKGRHFSVWAVRDSAAGVRDPG